MKPLIVLSLVLTVAACERHATESERQAANEAIRVKAVEVGSAEGKLKQMKAAGEVALQVEEVRKQKEELLKLREKNKGAIPLDVSERLAESERKKILDLY